MAADPQPQDAQSNDLFGRWLAHHEQQSPDGDVTGSAQGATDHNPPPRESRRMPEPSTLSSWMRRSASSSTKGFSAGDSS